MKNKIRKRILLLVLAGLPLFANAFERKDLLPNNVEFKFQINSLSAVRNGIEKSPFGRLWNDTKFRDFLGCSSDITIWDVLMEDEEESLRPLMKEAFGLFSGEIVFGVNPDTEEYCALIGITEKKYKRFLVLNEKILKAQKTPGTTVKSTFQGIEILKVIENNEDPAFFAWVNGSCITSPKKEWVEKTIMKLKKEAAKEPKANAKIVLSYSVSTILQNKPNMSEKNRRIYDALGLLGVRNIALSIDFQEDRLVFDGKLDVVDLHKGLFTLLDTQPSPLPKVPFIPKNIYTFDIERINIPSFWKELPNIMTDIDPTILMQFNMGLQMIRQNFGIDIEQDIINHLGTQILSFSCEGSDTPGGIVALELKNEKAFKKSIETLFAHPALQAELAQTFDVKTFLEHTVYSTKEAISEGKSIAFTFVDGYFVYGMTEQVRNVIRTSNLAKGASNYESAPLIQSLVSKIPPNAFGYLLIDMKKYLALLADNFQDPIMNSVLTEAFREIDSEVLDIQSSKLPSGDYFASFFKVLYGYSEPSPTGLHSRFILEY